MKWDILWGKIEWQKQTGDDFLKKKKIMYGLHCLYIYVQ